MQLNDFPVFGTKVPGVNGTFDLNDPSGRNSYFQAKVGKEIAQLKEFLKEKTFVAFLLGKKNSGKGTYSKLFMEAVGAKNVGHISVGDLVRDAHEVFSADASGGDLVEFLKQNYRGFHTIEEIRDIILGKRQDQLLSSELIVTLIKYEISKRPRQALFIDGFPRALDQIGYSLYLKELIGYRNDPDFLIFINVPNSIIDERIKYRVICPVCKTPRNLKLLATKEVGFDADSNNFFLKCDDKSCSNYGGKMVGKEGDELGIEPIRQRLELDNQIFSQLLNLQGIPKIYLRNSVPVTESGANTDSYELTPEYKYEYNSEIDKVLVKEEPWTIKDDLGVESYSFLPSAVVLSLIKQLVVGLGLS